MKIGNLFKHFKNLFHSKKTLQPVQAEPEVHVHHYPPEPVVKRKRLIKPKRYKRAFSCGYRGFPRSYTPPGLWPAPTIDQVRAIEKATSTRLHVRAGMLYNKHTGEKVSDWN